MGHKRKFEHHFGGSIPSDFFVESRHEARSMYTRKNGVKLSMKISHAILINAKERSLLPADLREVFCMILISYLAVIH